MSFNFTEEEHKMLQRVCKNEEGSGYELAWPAGWIGGLKFKLVNEWGEAGSALYHKLRDGLEGRLTVMSSVRTNERRGPLLEQRVTLKEGDGGEYVVNKVEVKKVYHLSEHRLEWSQLAREAKCRRRTVAPPTHHLFVGGHAKSEGQKLALVSKDCSQVDKKAKCKRFRREVPGLSKAILNELATAIAYLVEREGVDKVDCTTLYPDLVKPSHIVSALPELGKDIYHFIERRIESIINKKLKTQTSLS